MKVLVCGGRDYPNVKKVFTTLDAISKVDKIIEGGATGADKWARVWAETGGVANDTYRPNWNFGAAGGPIRNQRMLDEGKPDLVVAFPGGNGTADMIRRAKRAGVQVWEIK